MWNIFNSRFYVNEWVFQIDRRGSDGKEYINQVVIYMIFIYCISLLLLQLPYWKGYASATKLLSKEEILSYMIPFSFIIKISCSYKKSVWLLESLILKSLLYTTTQYKQFSTVLYEKPQANIYLYININYIQIDGLKYYKYN